jgi:gluconolactonase
MIAGEFREVARCRGPVRGVVADGTAVLFSAPDEDRIYRYDPAAMSVTVERSYTGRIDGLDRAPDGSLFAAQSGSRRVVVLEPSSAMTMPAERIGGKVHNHPAQVSVDGAGRIWFSDPHSPVPAPGAQVHPALPPAILRLSRDHRRYWRIQRMTFDPVEPYGVQVSPDDSEVYVTSTGERSDIRAYPVRADGALGTHRVLHTFGGDYRGAHRGGQGMTFHEGLLLVCAGASEAGPGPLVYAFESSGRIVATAPVPEPPNCCRVIDGKLYVSTMGGALLEADYVGRGQP